MRLNPHRFLLFLIILIGLVLYANSWAGSFVWDDEFLVVRNSYIRDWQGVFAIFTTELRQFEVTITSNFYRPLQALSYRLDYCFGRLNPFGYHFSNTLLHISVALLLYRLISLSSKNRIIALLTSLFFLVHPAHTEAVSYISGRAEPLVAFFLLLSLFLFIKHSYFPDRAGYYFGSLFSFVLALLSKEIAVVFPLALIAYGLCFLKPRPPSLKGSSIRHPYLWFILLSAGYLLLRLSLINFAGRLILTSKESLSVRAAGFFKAFLYYLGILVFPHNLHLERQMALPASFFEAEVLFSLILLAGFFALIVYALRRKQALLSFGLLWFFIFLFPVANLIPLDVAIAEHWLYLPSMGICLAFSAAISGLYNQRFFAPFKKALIYVLVLILAAYSALTVRQNRRWRNPLTLYSWVLKHNPGSFIVHNNLGIVYLRQGSINEAITQFKQALELKPDYLNAHNNLGNAYAYQGLFDLAIAEYEQALRLNPGLFVVRNNLNRVHEMAAEAGVRK